MFCVFIWIIFINIFINIIYIIWVLTKTPNKSPKLLCFKLTIILIFDWWLITLSNAFIFPEPEQLIINILHGWSGIQGHVFSCHIIKVNHFCVALSYYWIKCLHFNRFHQLFCTLFQRLCCMHMILVPGPITYRCFMHQHKSSMKKHVPYENGKNMPFSW